MTPFIILDECIQRTMPSKLHRRLADVPENNAVDEDISDDRFDGDDHFGEEDNDDAVEAFDEGCDAASFGDFDPMQALGQILVTHEGETIPDVLVGIRTSLDTLTKVIHKLSKTLEKK